MAAPSEGVSLSSPGSGSGSGSASGSLQYGLNSLHGNRTLGRKSLIFVKLTDSALQALEDFYSTRGASASRAKPSIQFQSNSNQGILRLPNSGSTQGHGAETRFSFSLANVDSDGPQGSFECIRQTRGQRSLDSLGKMDYKLQVHANEDSYEKTRVKMAVAEQESKKNSTKVIKESGPSIGRKVKVKSKGKQHLTSSATSNSSSISASVSASAPASAFSQQPGYSNNHSNNGYTNKLQPVLSPPTIQLNSMKMSGGSRVNGLTNGLGVSNGSNVSNHSSSRSLTNCSSNSPVNTDLMRKPLRERVIHLLAVRPFKKPELLARLMKDGFKEKDKKGLSLLLNSVSTLKDNAHHIARHAWQEVHEDWAHFSPEERELVRKRNPLLSITQVQQPHHPASINSTLSPLSSDCSSLQASPSPPNLLNLNSPSPGTAHAKRPPPDQAGQLANGVNSKRQRIAHFGSQPAQSRSKSPSIGTGLQTNGYHELISGWANKPKSPEMAPNGNLVAVSVPKNGVSSWGNGNTSQTDLRHTDCFQSKTINNHQSPESNGMSLPLLPQTVPQVQASSMTGSLTNGYATNGNSNSNATKKPLSNKVSQPQVSSSGFIESYRNNLGVTNGLGVSSQLTSSTANGHGHGTGSVGSTPNSSPDSGTGSHDGSLSTSSSRSLSSVNGETPDYMLKYTEITNIDQRLRYKADFNREYQEYRSVHKVLDVVAKKFAELEQRLKNSVEGSEEWNRIMLQIMREYEETKKESKYSEARRRVLYLHEKLSHIKHLVNAFDKVNPRDSTRSPRKAKHVTVSS